MSGSTVPAAVTALLALANAAAWPGEVEIIDGDPGPDIEVDLLCIGWGGDESAAVTVDAPISNLAVAGGQEIYDVACLLSSWTGDDSAAARTRVFALFDVFLAALAADLTVGGAVERATVESYALTQDLAGEGWVATITFPVRINAWRLP